jgi:hypothetical protein
MEVALGYVGRMATSIGAEDADGSESGEGDPKGDRV